MLAPTAPVLSSIWTNLFIEVSVCRNHYPRITYSKFFPLDSSSSSAKKVRTIPEIMAALQFGADEATAALKVLEHLDVVFSAIRLIGGKPVERWTIFWHRAERRRYSA